MATKVELVTPLIWLAWILTTFGWILVLSAAAALQQDCNSGDANAITVGGVVGYLGPVSCNKFYGYTWWITWYLFLAVVLLPVLLVADAVPKFRLGLLGLLGPLTMLVGDAANTFLYFDSLQVPSTFASRAKTMGAGAICSSIGLFITIALVGIADEKLEKVERTGEPTGETYGGRFAPPKEDTTSTFNPTYTQQQ